MFCLTTLSVVFTLVLSSPDGTKWSPINFTPIKMGPVKKRLTIVLDRSYSQTFKDTFTFVFKGQYSNRVSKFSIFHSIIKPPFPIPYCQILHGNGYFCDKKTKRKPYITQIFVILLTVVCYPVVASSPRRLAYLSKKKFNM